MGKSRTLLTLLVLSLQLALPGPASAQSSLLDRLVKRLKSDRETTQDEVKEAKTAETSDRTEPLPQDHRPVRTPQLGSKLQAIGDSRATIPLAGQQKNGQVMLQGIDGRISLVVRDAPIKNVIDLIAQDQGLNVVTAENITTRVSITLNDVPLEDALSSILSVAGYSWVREKDIIIVTSVSGGAKLLPQTQGRQLRVFRLDYASAADVSAAVRGLLSPAGQTFMSQIGAKDNRKTQELVVVEDIAPVLERIEDYIRQVDQPPPQVLIEANVLQVTLKDNYINGVDALIDRLGQQVFGKDFRIEMTGFANPNADQAFFFATDRDNLQALVELLQTTTDAKNLASPKVLVINGQEAYFQVGEKLGYKLITTTETSTQQSVSFLDVGVQLRVTPYISRDNQVMMHVKPEVSSGQINPLTEVPDAKTIQVDTNVLLSDGQGIVIGGLIQEEDSTIESKVPILGDLWLIGRLFQQRKANRERKEVIITLVPRVVPYDPCFEEQDRMAVHHNHTRLFQGALHRVPRPWEPRLPEAIDNPLFLSGVIPVPKVNLQPQLLPLDYSTEGQEVEPIFP